MVTQKNIDILNFIEVNGNFVEESLENYEYEFAAPIYSVIDRKEVGLKVITTVILDGEIMELEALRETVQQGEELEDE